MRAAVSDPRGRPGGPSGRAHRLDSAQRARLKAARPSRSERARLKGPKIPPSRLRPQRRKAVFGPGPPRPCPGSLHGLGPRSTAQKSQRPEPDHRQSKMPGVQRRIPRPQQRAGGCRASWGRPRGDLSFRAARPPASNLGSKQRSGRGTR